jgi:hypothetical protein
MRAKSWNYHRPSLSDPTLPFKDMQAFSCLMNNDLHVRFIIIYDMSSITIEFEGIWVSCLLSIAFGYKFILSLYRFHWLERNRDICFIFISSYNSSYSFFLAEARWLLFGRGYLNKCWLAFLLLLWQSTLKSFSKVQIGIVYQCHYGYCFVCIYKTFS